MTNIGARIVALRTEKNISLSKLSEECNISKSVLHRIENSPETNFELATLQKIARALKITVGHLMGNEIVKNVRQLPEDKPEWLRKLIEKLKADGKEPDPDFLEALYVIQNRKGQASTNDDEWLYLYQTFERSFPSSK